HTNGLPDQLYTSLSMDFEHDLADEHLLSKRLHETTQNNNECFNKLIRDCCSKGYFVEK
ncbi:unnamed protein product, partial [Lymnaea stagnalis]